MIRYLTASLCILLLAGCTQVMHDKLGLQIPEALELNKSWGPGAFFREGQHPIAAWNRVRTNGKGEPDFLSSSVDIRPPFRGTISFDIRINNLNFFSGVEFRLGDSEFKNYYAFAIPYFSDPDFNIIQEGEWHHYTFGSSHAQIVGTPQNSNLKQFGVYIQDNAKGSLIVDIANLQFTKPVLSQGIVSITFDDGYDEHLWAAEVMGKYGLRGTAYVMPRQIGRPGHLTLEQAKTMQARYNWGISVHHEIPFTDFSPLDLDRELKFMIDYLTKHGFSDSARHLAYPLGKQNRQYVLSTTKKYFQSARVAGGGAETYPPADIFLMRTYNVSNALAPRKIIADIESAVEAGQWIILMFHYLVDSPKTDYEYSKSQFEEIIKRIAENQLVVKPVHEVIQQL